MNELTIADLHAAKEMSKEKESYYRMLKAVDDKYIASWEAWKERLNAFDKALVIRLQETPLA